MSWSSHRKVQLYSFCHCWGFILSGIIQGYWKSYFSVGELTSSAKHFTGERPYTCSFCPATFRCKPHVQRHEEQHKGKKRFTCGVCNHATFQRSNMKVSNRLSTEASSRKFLRTLTFLGGFDLDLLPPAKVMFLQVSVCPRGGACVAGGGVHGRGSGACMAPPGRYYEIRWYGQWAGGTHPTGMHSSYIFFVNRNSIYMKKYRKLFRVTFIALWRTRYLCGNTAEKISREPLLSLVIRR